MSSLSSPVPHDAAQRRQLLPLLRRLALLGAGLSLGPLILIILKLNPSLDLLFQSPVTHFWVVTIAALTAVCLALLILRAAIGRRDGRVLLIGSAFLSISSTFLIHAVATPGVVFSNTSHATSWSTPIALAVGAALLALSTSERFARQPWLFQRWRVLLLGGFALWALYGGFMLLYVPDRPDPADETAAHHASAAATDPYDAAPPVADAPTLQEQLLELRTVVYGPLYSVIVLLYLGTAAMYGRRWYDTPTRPLAALAIGALLLAETSIAAYSGILWHISFWLYHLLLLAAVVTVIYGVAVGYQRGGAPSSAVSGWLLRSTVQRQQAVTQRAMAILLSALEHGSMDMIPQLRGELRQRFSLADDQLDLLEHAVRVVAREREEQQRLRALTEVSAVATRDLDPDLLLHNAVTMFGQSADLRCCSVGLTDGAQVTFKPEHCYVRGRSVTETVVVPLAAPLDQGAAVDPGALGGMLAALGLDAQPALEMPLLHHDRVLGVLVVQPNAAAPIDERMLDVCRSLTSQLAIALANARLYQELQHKHANLLRSEQAREQLTQMIVHDLKNPLTAIRGYHSLLRMTDLTDEQQELVAGAHRSSSLMLQLVTDILDIARLEEGRLELRRAPTEIVALIADCCAELRPWAEHEQKQVAIKVAAGLPPLLLDARLIGRVLTNLLSNAIKHTPAGTSITIGAALDADAVRLWVHDTGQGVAPEHARHLFERFRAAASESEQQSSTGLGLAFCKLAVEAHQGRIAVDSTPGRGTTFTIALPSEVAAPA
jgi:signal transduction histidine kinase